MSRPIINRLMERASANRRQQCLKMMRAVPFLSEMSVQENENLIDVMGVYSLQKGDLVNVAGEGSSEFFIIEHGVLGTYAKGKMLRQNHVGDPISEMSLIEDS